MRAVVQRVSRASVTVDGEEVGAVGAGLLVYVGVAVDDGPDDVEFMANKIRHLRVFRDDEGKMNRDVGDIGGGILVISNFSLMGDARKGRRPAYVAAAEPSMANRLYEALCDRLGSLGLEVQTGRFREMMSVGSENDGPINILLDSRRTF